MSATIRPATSNHAPAIASVKRAAWPGEPSDETLIAAAIADASHRTHIACVAGRVVGFVDGFVTEAASGQLRWEVDLLAVHPDFRGQKIGQQLIAATTWQAQQQGLPLARALVQVDNLLSQRVFRRCGYETDNVVYRLMVTDAADFRRNAFPPNAHLVPVNTLNYRGLWLEGDLSDAALAAAQTERVRRGCDLAGALIPSQRDDLQSAAMALGYAKISHFQWWICHL